MHFKAKTLPDQFLRQISSQVWKITQNLLSSLYQSKHAPIVTLNYHKV
jgi:hypothetical protein